MCSADFILQSRVFCLRSHTSWHDWQTLLAESLMDGSSTLQLMHAPGSSVKGSGTRSWQVLQICGREGGGCMVGGES